MIEKAKLIPIDALPDDDQPTGRKGRGIWIIAVRDFMASGDRLCRVETIKERKYAANGLYVAIRRLGLSSQVGIITRNGRCYLVRLDEEQTNG